MKKMVWLSRNATLDISAFVPCKNIDSHGSKIFRPRHANFFFVVSGSLHAFDFALSRAKQTVVGLTSFVDDESIASTI